jgi:ribA/ribD-fused uncharacterized protein
MFRKISEDTLLISMSDATNPLATCSHHPIKLDDIEWPSVEHYINAMRFEDGNYREKIRLAPHPTLAHKLGKSWFKKKRSDWKKTRDAYMTRAIWIKCKTYPEVAQELLDTGDRPFLETSNFDYYWGCGRDTRGQNKYGLVLQAVRDRLRKERSAVAE